MQRICKLFYMIVGKLSREGSSTWYWADRKRRELWKVTLLPTVYYKALYTVSMKGLKCKSLWPASNWVIHTIPFHTRINILQEKRR